MIDRTLLNRTRDIAAKLDAYVVNEEYKGWDPYDAMNSPRLFSLTKFHPFAQRVGIHLLKFSPVNFRHFLGINKDLNPTALSLFIETYINYAVIGNKNENLKKAYELADILVAISCINTTEELGWGRNFKFITTEETHEVGKPLTFLNTRIGNAYLGLFEISGDKNHLKHVKKIIVSTIRQCGFRHTSRGVFFAYSTDQAPRFIHNASIMTAELFAKYLSVSEQNDEVVEGQSLRGLCVNLIETLLNDQESDGSWPYGYTFDNKKLENKDFHQGFVIDSLMSIANVIESGKVRDKIIDSYERGLAFLAKKQITSQGVFKWRYPRTYPVDINNQAQGIISLSKSPDDRFNTQLEAILRYTLDNFWDDRRGYFYYQKNPLFTNRIPYMRWSQGWMSLALSSFLKRFN